MKINAPRLARILVAMISLHPVATAGPPPLADGQGATSRPWIPPAVPPASAWTNGLLAGPRVEPAALSRADEPERPARAARRPSIAPRRWLALLREIELTTAQRTDVRAIVSTITRERRAFQRQYGAELKRLRRAVAEARESATPPPGDLIARFEAVRAKGPNIERRQQQIWNLLTPLQQDAMRRAIARERGRRRGGRQKWGRGSFIENEPRPRFRAS